jgi:hypothetical protein
VFFIWEELSRWSGTMMLLNVVYHTQSWMEYSERQGVLRLLPSRLDVTYGAG